MTDREKLETLLTEWGVPYESRPNTIYPECVAIEVKSGSRGDHPKLVGYNGLITVFYFNGDGSFDAMGAWE